MTEIISKLLNDQLEMHKAYKNANMVTVDFECIDDIINDLKDCINMLE